MAAGSEVDAAGEGGLAGDEVDDGAAVDDEAGAVVGAGDEGIAAGGGRFDLAGPAMSVAEPLGPKAGKFDPTTAAAE